ncbi:MAG: hypothetical protein HRU15_19865 [Planctomycetes bacterium]|nr:hypothetical protein [Planctomycetota bacterium]
MRYLLTTLSLIFVLACTSTLSAVEINMKGTYVWVHQADKEGEVTAHFKTNEEGTLDAQFNFIFDKKDHIYKGSCSADKDKKTISGSVKTEDEERTFTFTGSLVDGEFKGTHKEGDQDTGTITMKVVK